MKTIGYITTTIIIFVISAIASGWCFSILWGWFIVKTFGLTQLSIPAAIGITSVVTYLTAKIDLDKENTDEIGIMLFKGVAVTILKLSVYLGIGYIVHLFM